MADIFVSYAHQDFEVVNKVMHSLHDLGFDYWMDRKDLQGGDYWSDGIATAIADADTILLFISSASMASSYVVLEVQTAFKHRKRAVLVQLEENTVLHPQLEKRLSTIQWINHEFTEWFPRLVMALRGIISVPNSPRTRGFILKMGLGFLLPIFGCIAINIVGFSKYFFQNGWLPNATQIISTSFTFLVLVLFGATIFMIGLEQISMAAIGKVANINWNSVLQTTWQFLAQTFANRDAFIQQILRYWTALRSITAGGFWNDADFRDRTKAVVAGIIPGLGLYLRGRVWWAIFFFLLTIIGYSELFPGILFHLASIVATAVMDRPKRSKAEVNQYAGPS